MTGEPTGTRPLNDYSEITIKGTKYKIHSIFEGEKSFQSLLEDLIVTKAAQHRIMIARNTKLRYNENILKPICCYAAHREDKER